MILLTRDIGFVVNELIGIRNRIPGFLYTSPTNLCCPLDEASDSMPIEYEPGYAHIHENVLHINSPILDKKEFGVCEKTGAKIQSNFDKFRTLYYTDISFARLKSSKARELTDSDTNACFIFSKDLSKMLCIEIDGWIYPIVTRFVSLNEKPSQQLIIGWNLSILRSREENKTHIIEMNIIKPIKLNLLCKKDVDVRMIGLDAFYLQVSKDSVQHFKKYMNPIAERETDEEKKSRLSRERKLRAVHYLGCFLVCFLFLFSTLKTINGSNRREA